MDSRWTHIGRLWTNGEPYLAADFDVRHLWLGFTEDEYFDRIVELAPTDISISLGGEAAAVVGGDGVVRDDSWMEVFESTDGVIAIVQASGADYQRVVADALEFAKAPAEAHALINTPSGQLAIFSAACDGAGEHAMMLLPPQPGHAPVEHGPPARDNDTGLHLPARSTRYRVEAWSYTELGDSAYFARWLLIAQ